MHCPSLLLFLGAFLLVQGFRHPVGVVVVSDVYDPSHSLSSAHSPYLECFSFLVHVVYDTCVTLIVASLDLSNELFTSLQDDLEFGFVGIYDFHGFLNLDFLFSFDVHAVLIGIILLLVPHQVFEHTPTFALDGRKLFLHDWWRRCRLSLGQARFPNNEAGIAPSVSVVEVFLSENLTLVDCCLFHHSLAISRFQGLDYRRQSSLIPSGLPL